MASPIDIKILGELQREVAGPAIAEQLYRWGFAGNTDAFTHHYRNAQNYIQGALLTVGGPLSAMRDGIRAHVAKQEAMAVPSELEVQRMLKARTLQGSGALSIMDTATWFESQSPQLRSYAEVNTAMNTALEKIGLMAIADTLAKSKGRIQGTAQSTGAYLA